MIHGGPSIPTESTGQYDPQAEEKAPKAHKEKMPANMVAIFCLSFVFVSAFRFVLLTYLAIAYRRLNVLSNILIGGKQRG